MTDTMRAVVNHGPHDYRLETVARPTPSDGEVVIRVEAAGICGSDAKCYTGSAMFWEGDPSWVRPPVIPGHEFYGTVVELGDGADERHGVAVGDTVIAEQIYPCDACRFCRRGEYWMCQVHDIFGFQRDVADGAWADYMRLGRRARIHRMPADISRRAGVLVEPFACALHAVARADVGLDDVVMLHALRLRSPRTIIVTDARPERLAVAQRLGADVVVDVKEQDPAEVARSYTEGYGCDVFIEATGHPTAVEQGLDALRRLGTMLVYGVFGSPVTVDWSIIGDRKGLDVRGAHLGPYCYPTAIDLLHRGVVDADTLVTHEFPLERFDEALGLVQRGDAIKVMLRPEVSGEASG